MTDALQSLLIIPRSPTPIPLEDRDVETLTREELTELERRRHVSICLILLLINSHGPTFIQAPEAIKKEREAIKRERKDEGEADVEQNPIRLKSMRGANGKRIYILDSEGEEEGDTQGDKENDELEDDNGDVENADPWMTAQVVDLT